MRTVKQPRQSYGQENALNTDAQNLPKEMSDRFVLVTAFFRKNLKTIEDFSRGDFENILRTSLMVLV